MSEPKAYQWDFAGACAPDQPQFSASWVTFSVGIFQWLPKAGGRGLKRGKVVRRVKGYVSDPQECYDRAHRIVTALNAQD
jgi:hypothetical protein